MEPKTIEGTWEEITRHAQEFAGHRVRVTVLDTAAIPTPPGGTHADEEAPGANPIMGMFRDAPELLDEVVEEAMMIREDRPWRLPPGE